MSASNAVRKPGIAWRIIEDEALLVDSSSGLIYPLNAAAARIWELLDGTRSSEELCAQLAAEFETAGTLLKEDVEEFLAALIEQGLAVRAGAKT